ncbi:hypothetical protein N7540_011179 [Penicillium herquei]|nr:hypothetical protein N7540_011179 [Penicillium herquei]
MSLREEPHPPAYTESARDPPPEISPHTLISMAQAPDPQISSLETTINPAMPVHTRCRRWKRLKKGLAKVLKIGAGAIALTAAVPVVFVTNVAYEGGKAVLLIVSAPFLICAACFCIDDFDL